MKKGVFLLSNVDESRLQAGFEVLHLSFENGSDHSIFVQAFNVEALQNPIFHHRHSSLKSLGVDDQLLVVLILLASEEGEDAFSDRAILRSIQCGLTQLLLVDVNGLWLGGSPSQVILGLGVFNGFPIGSVSSASVMGAILGVSRHWVEGWRTHNQS